MELIFKGQGFNQELRVAESVLKHFKANQQTGTRPEVGGQLFGKIEDGRVIIVQATGPYPEDTSKRFWFLPSRSRERKDIDQLFKKGLHYLGDWHTHPEVTPTPSSVDLGSMADCYKESKHHHGSFVLIIVGTESFPESLSVTLHRGQDVLDLQPSV